MHPYLSNNWFGQIGTLEESDGFSSTDPAISIQICYPEAGFQLIRIRTCHFPPISHQITTTQKETMASRIECVGTRGWYL
ncbi:hypothetical protein ACFX2I_005017 [Malus domestica]